MSTTEPTAAGVNVACGRPHSVLGDSSSMAARWMPAAIASGDIRVVARFMSGVAKPKHAAPSTQASAAISVVASGRTGPSRTIRPTPTRPSTQPSSLRRVSVSSLIHADDSVPNSTAVVLSRAL